MRTIHGSIVLPADAPRRTCGRLVVEVRDVSMLDAPSTVVVSRQWTGVELEPNGRIAFQLDVPNVDAGRSLSLRVHGSLDGSEQVKRGDLLTTASYPLATVGTPAPVVVAVKVI